MSNTSKRATEDDVEGHGLITSKRATEDDVEGHGLITSKRATEDDVEGHGLITSKRATEDDVEGHNIGALNPILARELARARERDVQREASRNSLIGEAKRALGRKR
jgi:hypothetical protein